MQTATTRQFSLIIFSFLLLAFVSNVISDGDIELCRIDDEQCLMDAANEILAKYSKGIELFNLPSIDPLRINELRVVQDLNAVKVDANVHDTDMTGFSTAKLSKFSGLQNGNVEIKFLIKSGTFNGPYKISGKLLKLPIEGKGDLKITYKNMDSTLKFKVTNKTIDGKTYLHAEEPWMTLSISAGTANLSHLGSIANSFVNWSFVILVNAVKDTFCKPFSQVLIDKLNEMFDNIPVEDLFKQ